MSSSKVKRSKGKKPKAQKKTTRHFMGGPFNGQMGLLSNGTTYYFRLRGMYGRYVNWEWESHE